MNSITLTLVQNTRLAEQVELPPGISVMGQNFAVQPYHRVFRILDPKRGDERLVWDSRNFSDLKAARQMFIEFIKKGLTPFRVGLNGKATAEVMREFDPTAEEVIFLPTMAVAGG